MRKTLNTVVLVLVSCLLIGQESWPKSHESPSELGRRAERANLAMKATSSCSTKGQMNLGVPISGNLTVGSCQSSQPPYGTLYADFYTFTALGGHTYELSAQSSLTYIATFEDPQYGIVLVSTGPCGFTTAECSATYTAPVGGTYVVGFGAFNLGSYTIALADVTGASATPTPGPVPTPTPSANACGPLNPNALCLNNRFQVTVSWDTPAGQSGQGTAIGMTSDTGYFWFFSDSNVELVVKVLDGRAINNHFWVFYGALSNVHYVITVTDTQTGISKPYENPQGQQASISDTAAF
ncbi:MAG TPA: hypothetical protein VKG23_00255 [Thermoanaerobaculia bacterium]|nr:hypothetical protein [Thermoanaerobaculia bacterium]